MTACVLGHTETTEAYLGQACRRHYHWINDTLREIETLFALRAVVILPSLAQLGDERRGTQVDAAAPGRLSLMALTDRRVAGRKPPMTFERNWNASTETLEPNGDDDEIDVMGVLGGWYRLLVEEGAVDEPPRHLRPVCTNDLCGHLSCARARGFVSLTTIIRALRSQQQWIVAQPWVELFFEELGDTHRALARAIGDSMWPRPVGKCPNCQTPLYNTIGLDEVTCRRCRTTWTGVHLARLRLIHEQEAKCPPSSTAG